MPIFNRLRDKCCKTNFQFRRVFTSEIMTEPRDAFFYENRRPKTLRNKYVSFNLHGFIQNENLEAERMKDCRC